MSILQFAFGSDPQAPTFRPHNYPREVVAYTGTHDNDTTSGGGTARRAEVPRAAPRTSRRAGIHQGATSEPMAREINWVFIQTLHRLRGGHAFLPRCRTCSGWAVRPA